MTLLKRFAYFLLCAACATLFATGCVSSVKKFSASGVSEEAPLAAGEEEADPTEPEPEADDSSGIDIVTDIDDLLRQARQACADSQFTAADTLLRRAAAFLMKNSELPEPDSSDGEWFPLQDYIADIISTYAEFMPAGFSAPEEISAMIFSRHLLESLLDSLTISPQDSIFLARLSNKRGVSYDVPMVWNNRVKRAMLFYIRTRKGVFDRWLHRSSYYLPVMKKMFADSGLPQDLAHLPIIESGFNPHAYSRAHAAGIWQFIPSTGKYYGLRQNYWLDERRDPIKATDAAIRYLRKLYGDFGNWHIALASYNCGENGMARSIKKSGSDGSDYWSLSLPKETMNYVPLFLAALVIAKNPDVFEFALADSTTFDPDTVTINDCVEMSTIAAGIDVPLDTLTKLNPQILHWCTPPDIKNVRLYVPKGSAGKFKEFYDSLPDEKKTKFYRYKIKGGDNLLQIARNFRVPVEALREINKMKTNSISTGKFVIIPIPLNDSVPAALAAHLNSSERERPGKRGRANSGARGTVTSRSGKRITYKVRTGETLYSISNTFGVSVNDLMAWNYLANPRSLKAEQTLIIYKQDSPEQAQTSSAAAPKAASSTGSASSSSASSAPAAQRVRGNATEYSGKRLVKQGETLYGISQELGVSVSELARINGLNARRPLIFPGDVLVYAPGAGNPAAQASGTPTSANTPASASASQSTSAGAAQTASTNAAARTPAIGSGQTVLYTVKPGDNLWRISLNFGVTVDSIREGNNLTARSVIMPGDILRIIR